jgi:hypothetical protein
MAYKSEPIRTNQLEQTYISKLVLDGMDEIVEGWRKILGKSLKIDVASIFCHQRPYITFVDDSDKSCEIADVLFLHCYKNIFGVKTYKAILLQAKKDSGANKEIKLNIDPQLELYTKFPGFRYGQTNTKKKNGLYI